jgi:hypothetical protein
MTRLSQCIVHAGTHKTGTTTVQQVMATHRADLAACAYLYPAMDAKGRDHNAMAHRIATCSEQDLQALHAKLAGVIAASNRLHGDAKLVISAEELSTRIGNADPWVGFDEGNYWERRGHYLARLRRVLPDATPIAVYICFRDHESYAHALYATKVLSGKIRGSFADFVRRCAPIFDYRRQAEVLADTLGPVHVESYERLRADLANRFFAWMGVPLQVAHTPRLRPTLALDLIHWLARASSSDPGLEEHARRSAFARARAPDAEGQRVAVESLWQSAQQRLDFLDRCKAPPLDGWPRAPLHAHIVEPQVLERRADQLEVEYRQWLGSARRRRHWSHFWRRR